MRFSCLNSSRPRVKVLSWFPHFQVVARASVYPSVRCRNCPFLWQRWGRPGQGGGQGLSCHPRSGRGRRSERQTDLPRRPGAPGPGGLRDLDRRWRHEAAVGAPWRLPPPVSQPSSFPRVCHRGRWSVLPRRRPCVFGTPGVAPRPSEAKAQTERATRGGNGGVLWGCAFPGIPACGARGCERWGCWQACSAGLGTLPLFPPLLPRRPQEVGMTCPSASPDFLVCKKGQVVPLSR